MIKQIDHIAFIMDGNGRYAQQMNKARTFGHLEGAKRIPEIILSCQEHHISFISFFAFSTENWNRSKTEVTFLMKLLEKYLSKKSIKWFEQHQINLNVIGFKDNLNSKLFKKIKDFEAAINQKQYRTKVNIFFNYGGRDEIINAINTLINTHQTINKENFEKCLMTNGIPDMDLLIRTSGEKRISNFMLWQLAYSEIIFEEAKWPEYTKEILNKNILEYYSRDRRFGKINDAN